MSEFCDNLWLSHKMNEEQSQITSKGERDRSCVTTQTGKHMFDFNGLQSGLPVLQHQASPVLSARPSKRQLTHFVCETHF